VGENEEGLNNDQRNLIFTIKLKAPNLSLGALLIYLLFIQLELFRLYLKVLIFLRNFIACSLL
jgi:hypothetical protein